MKLTSASHATLNRSNTMRDNSLIGPGFAAFCSSIWSPSAIWRAN
jgi:hypothetical protein